MSVTDTIGENDNFGKGVSKQDSGQYQGVLRQHRVEEVPTRSPRALWLYHKEVLGFAFNKETWPQTYVTYDDKHFSSCKPNLIWNPKQASGSQRDTEWAGFTWATGWQFNNILLAWKRAQISARNWPELPFEKDACMNFLFWTFRATFWASFNTVVMFLTQ